MTLKAPPTIYRILSLVLFPWWSAHALWQAIKHRNGRYFLQRMGLSKATQAQTIWLHAASIGEVEMLKPLVQWLQKNHAVLITTFTVSGLIQARRLFPPQIKVQALPIDFYPLSKAFIRRNRFTLALIAETELWPETLYQAKAYNIPLLHINARLSAKSRQTYEWIKSILQSTLLYFDSHITRTLQDMDDFVSMGVQPAAIQVLGNLKYAQSFETEEYPNLIGRRYILFASTHEPEERIFADLMQQAHETDLCVIAPRHPHRINEILRALKPLNLRTSVRSRNESIEDDTQLYIADTLGELKALMQHAELVVMGGSFNETGGHNVLEPARLGKAILTGPSDDNIRADIRFLQQHDAIIQVENATQLSESLNHLLSHRDRLLQLGGNASVLMHRQVHVLEHYQQAINHFL